MESMYPSKPPTAQMPIKAMPAAPPPMPLPAPVQQPYYPPPAKAMPAPMPPMKTLPAMPKPIYSPPPMPAPVKTFAMPCPAATVHKPPSSAGTVLVLFILLVIISRGSQHPKARVCKK